MKLQLIALVAPSADTGGGYSAIVYDPDIDRTVTLNPGDQVGGRKVERITGLAVEFREGAAVRTLSLAEAQRSFMPSVAGGVP